MKPVQHSWRTALALYSDRRLWIIFLLGISSGFPWVMIGSAMTAWLQEGGISRSEIGLFGLIFVAYSINFLWAPLIDRVNIPIVGKGLGHRRSWIVMMQIVIAVLCFTIAASNPVETLSLAKIAAFGLAIASATQDISIDAFRIDSFTEDEPDLLSASAAMATAGWWTGFAGLGALPFLFADTLGWTWVYQLMAATVFILMLAPLFSKEPALNLERLQSELSAAYQGDAPSTTLNHIRTWLVVSFYAPLAEFFKRSGPAFAVKLLLFIFLFKIGEAFLGRMSIVFYKEIGFSNADIGTYSKLISWYVTIAFSLLGSLFAIRHGLYRGLMIGGIAMASSNLMFALLALAGPSKFLLVAAVVVDGFTSAWSTVAFVAFISALSNRAFTATQYALMASIGTLGRTFFASYSGMMVDYLSGNWFIFFALTAVMVAPSLVLLRSMKDNFERL